MAVRGRERMIQSVDALTGAGRCREAVLAQERPAWVGLAPAAVVVLCLFVLPAAGLPVPAGAALGGVAGSLLFALPTTYWIVARVDDDVVLARSSKLRAKAMVIAHTEPAPATVAEEPGGVGSRKVRLAGHLLYVPKQFERRFDDIVGP